MSSIVTVVPTGILPEWCVKVPWFGLGPDPQGCANSTRGTQESDFETICCDGDIINTKQNLFEGGLINIEDLICCRLEGPQRGGLFPVQTGWPTSCRSGVPVPLTSLAATNTKNAQNFLVTYTSASFGGPTPGDFIPTKTPYCLWAYTKSGVGMKTITLPAPDITTLPSTSYEIGTAMFTLDSSSVPEDSADATMDGPSAFETQTMGDNASETSPESSATATSSSAASSARMSSSSGLVSMLCGLAFGLWGRVF